MKLYKRTLLALLTFVLIVSLSGCIIIPLSKYYDIPAEEVNSVQFYHYDPDTSSESDYNLIHTVSEESKEAFLDDFSKLKFTDSIIITLAAIDPSFSYGDWVVRINFSDGQYTLYSSGGYGETFDAEGNCTSATHFSCDAEELEQLIEKYNK